MLNNIIDHQALKGAVLLCLTLFAGCQPELSSEEVMQRAQGYSDEGNYGAAVIELIHFLQSNPQHSESRLMLANLYILQRDGKGAAAQLQKARDLSQGAMDIRRSLGKALLLQDAYDPLLAKIVIDESDTIDVKTDLTVLHAYAYFYKKNVKQAEQLFKQVQLLNEKSTAALTGLALINLERENYAIAGQQIEQALAIDAANIDAWVIKGRLGLDQKQYKKAEEAFNRALNLKSQAFTFLSPIQAHVFLVQSFINQAKVEEAGLAVDTFATNHPRSPMLHYLRANIAYESGDFEKAGEFVQVFRSAVPNYDPGLLLEGVINYELGRLERANSALAQYFSRHPDSETARKLLAVIRLKLREPEQAFELVAPLLKQQPDNLPLLLLAGNAMRDAGKPAASVPIIKKALQQDPDNVELKMQLASTYIANQETEKAMHLLKALPPTADKFGKRELLMLLAWTNEDNYVEALAFADDYLAAHPDDADVYAHSGVIFMRMGKEDAAREKFEKSLSLKPDNPLMLMALVRLEYQQKNYSRTETLLDRLLKIQPENASVMYALANVTTLRGDEKKAINLLERARQASAVILEPRLVLIKYYLKQGEVTKARDLGKEITKIAPQRADVWNAYSVVQNKMGDSQGAVDSLLVATRLQPDSKTVLMNLAQSQIRTGKNEDARLTLKKLLKLSPDNFQAASILALIEIKKGETERAFEIAQKQQTYKANRLNALALEGDLYMITGKHDLAANVYKKAIEASPSTVLIVKRYSAMKKAALPEMREPLLQWLRNHSDDTTVRLLLAGDYEVAGDLESAIKEYEKLTTQKPDDAGILNNLAIAYHRHNDAKAVLTAEKAYKLNTESAAIKDTFGWILVQRDQVERGLSLLSAAVSKLPDNMEVQYHYAVALNKSGDRHAARNLLQKLVNKPLSSPVREEAKKYLQTLK